MMHIIKKWMLVLIAFSAVNSASGSVLVTNAGVKEILTSWYFSELIIVTLDGYGTGDCTNSVTVAKVNFTGMEDNYDRTYTMLMSALVTGKKIDIYGGVALDCTSTTFTAIKQ